MAYDPTWPDRFLAVRAELAPILTPWLAGGIHHIGSTSVPGLAAKPIIDVIAGVRDLDAARAAVPVLAAQGWTHAKHRPEALWFFRLASGVQAVADRHIHHLHLTRPGSDLWRERLAFRDALAADPGLAAEYSTLKRRLADAGADGPAYSAGKRPFVARILAAAGIVLAAPAPAPSAARPVSGSR